MKQWTEDKMSQPHKIKFKILKKKQEEDASVEKNQNQLSKNKR